MCKGRYKETSYKGYRLQEIYDKLGDTKVIHSIVPVEVSDRQLMMRCMGELWSDADLREEVDGLDAIVDGWNHILVNERKKIFWEDLYNKDLQSRDPQAVHETAPKLDHETAHATAPKLAPKIAHETAHETASETANINEQLRIVLSELVQVKGQLGAVTNKLKTVEEFMEDQRREKRNYREDEEFNWRPPRRGWYETGGTSGSAQGVHEMHTPIPEMHTPIPEMHTPIPEMHTTIPEMLRTPAPPTAPEFDTPAPSIYDETETAPEMDTPAQPPPPTGLNAHRSPNKTTEVQANCCKEGRKAV